MHVYTSSYINCCSSLRNELYNGNHRKKALPSTVAHSLIIMHLCITGCSIDCCSGCSINCHSPLIMNCYWCIHYYSRYINVHVHKKTRLLAYFMILLIFMLSWEMRSCLNGDLFCWMMREMNNSFICFGANISFAKFPFYLMLFIEHMECQKHEFCVFGLFIR